MNPFRTALDAGNQPMNNDPVHPDLFTLPASLRAVDALLAREAARSGVPHGLVDRVFAASVIHLPALVEIDTSPARLRLTHGVDHVRGGLATRSGRLVGWGRFALAACMGLAFVLGGRMLLHSAPPVRVAATEFSLELRGISDLVAFGDEVEDVDLIFEARRAEYDDIERDLQALHTALGSR